MSAGRGGATVNDADDTSGVIRENFREYLDHLLRDGFSVRHDEHLSDPDLIDPGGDPVETWREDYPYDERLDRDVYEEEKYQLQIELLRFQYWAQDTGTKHLIRFEAATPPARAAPSSGSPSTSTPQPARRPRRRPDQTDRDRARPMVLPPLHRPAPDRRGDRAVRPVLVQPRRRRAGHGLLHRALLRVLPAAGPAVRGDADRERLLAHQAVVLGHPVRAAHPLRDPPDRPGAPVEALTDGHRVPGPVGRLHPRQGSDDRAHGHRQRPVDLDQEQRQEARPHQCDAVLPQPVRLRGQGPVGGLPRGPSAGATRPGLDQGLTRYRDGTTRGRSVGDVQTFFRVRSSRGVEG